MVVSKPILVFSLSLDQAEQFFCPFQIYELMGDSKELYKAKSDDGQVPEKVEKAFQVNFALDLPNNCLKSKTNGIPPLII